MMKELTSSQRIDLENRLRELIKELEQLDLKLTAGNYDSLLEQVWKELALNDVKKGIFDRKYFYKRKRLLFQVEYLAIQLTKNSTLYGME